MHLAKQSGKHFELIIISEINSDRSYNSVEMQDYWIEESIKEHTFDEFYELGKELGK